MATLKVGGEIPITLKSLHFSYVQWKPYGLNLELAVPGVMDTKARTNIRVEMTTLDAANGQDGVPATKLNHLETVVDLPFDKPIFLSGLMQDQTSEDIKGLAGLSSIPILGALFRSKDFQDKRSELVIALTAQKVAY
jgi:pilus assembly protein CpaC